MQFFGCNLEAGDSCEASEISVSIVTDQGGSVIDNCTATKTLNNKLLFEFSGVRAADFHNTVLNNEYFVGNLIFFAQDMVFFIGHSFKAVNDFLFRHEAESSEVINFVASHFQENLDFIIVEANLFFE